MFTTNLNYNMTIHIYIYMISIHQQKQKQKHLLISYDGINFYIKHIKYIWNVY